eukprot:TRINITY_DN37529_c0_g1_i1.p1 TRINITY_DN37529_c0_g1~~TRINITY_DN37529_c0_g1_i1.p1  ORF type:complete len:187 (-),score=43.75 TRINITY_DN37529_c0_g1_i1:80-610(-)
MPPASNRLSVSDSLATHKVWQQTVGHDPYKGDDEGGGAVLDGGEINQSAKGLFRLAQLTGNSSTLAPGACKRCGQVGHLYFQCRNTFSFKQKTPNPNEQMLNDEDDDPDSGAEVSSESGSDSDDSDSDSSEDSDEDENSSSSSHKKKKKRKKSSKKEKKKKKDKKTSKHKKKKHKK